MINFNKATAFIISVTLAVLSQPTPAATYASAAVGSSSGSTQVSITANSSSSAFSAGGTYATGSAYSAGRAFASNSFMGNQTIPGNGFYQPAPRVYTPYYTAPTFYTGLRWQQERLEEELREAKRIEQKEKEEYHTILSKESSKAKAEHAQLLQENASLKQRLEGKAETRVNVCNVTKTEENPEGEIRIHRASTANTQEVAAKSNRILKNAKIEHRNPDKCLRYAIKEFRKESENLKVENESLKAKLEQQDDYRLKSFPSE